MTSSQPTQPAATRRDISVRTDRDHGSLWRWLAADPDTRGLLTGTGGPLDEEQQGAFEVVNALIANGLALSSLTVAIAGWRSQRRSDPPTVTLERDGVSVVVTDASPEQIAAIAAALGVTETDEPA
ncbi:hypothetical protein AB0M80_43655 [Amycolatopsis sp. NPDC051045]|uniref:effector-associated constant component EACC1 n=1 Tax=Amycolatopsis sp. NPDC051045 TaxID=3156922 RepID=UPI003412BA0A